MDEYDYTDFCNAKCCHICNKEFNKKDIKVRYIDHTTRKTGARLINNVI
ncbi:MAG: hypothetical protein ACKPKO_16540 [Candidatus Fonsibacter sp.]